MGATNGKPALANSAAKRIAEVLGETKPATLGQIKRIVETLGDERALALLGQASEIAQQRCLGLGNRSRQPTVSSAFSRLVPDQTSQAERERLWTFKTQTKAIQRPAQNATNETERRGIGCAGPPYGELMAAVWADAAGQ